MLAQLEAIIKREYPKIEVNNPEECFGVAMSISDKALPEIQKCLKIIGEITEDFATATYVKLRFAFLFTSLKFGQTHAKIAELNFRRVHGLPKKSLPTTKKEIVSDINRDILESVAIH